jgi:hypothetical protein
MVADARGPERTQGNLRSASQQADLLLYMRVVREAFLARAEAERNLGDAVVRARHEGHSWAAVGAMVGTSGEAARQRYGQAVKAE